MKETFPAFGFDGGIDLGYGVVLLAHEVSILGSEVSVAEGENAHCQEGAAGGPVFGHGGERDPGRHLDDRPKGFVAATFALHGDGDHWQWGVGGGHAREVGGAAGAGNDDFEAALSCAGGGGPT